MTLTVRSTAWINLLLILALGIRVGWVVTFQRELTQDRDAYLSLATNLAAGSGYTAPGGKSPTAYRPPLYPLVLSAALDSVGTGKWVAIVNITCGTLTVLLTYLLARRLLLPRMVAGLAALLVSIDPLLLRYTSLPMTETLCSMLVTGYLVLLCSDSRSAVGQFCLGVIFGLSVLCRPTVWPFLGLYGLWVIVQSIRAQQDSSEGSTGGIKRSMVTASLAAVLVVTPWVARNTIALGSPVLNTTHGGYTLLLGNNPAFYDEVVRQPFGTVWDGSHGPGQAAWIAAVEREMDQAGIAGEVARDRWLTRRAFANINDRPGDFLCACLLRVRRFWGTVPLVTGAEGRLQLMAVQVFYVTLFLTFTIGAIVCIRRQRIDFVPLLLMVLTFVSVHTTFWANARMRAPVTPIIAILSAYGLWTLTGWWRTRPE